MDMPPPMTHVSFEPPPWLEFTTSPPSRSATRVRPPGRTQMFSPSFTANGRRSTWRGTMVLSTHVGDVERATSRCAIQCRGSASTSSASWSSSAPVASRPDDQSFPSRPVYSLEDEITSPGQRVLPDGAVDKVHGLDVLQYRVLAEVVPDHCRHVGVDELVVGHPVPNSVRDGDSAGSCCVHHSGTSHQRLRSELQRIEVLVVDSAVDHMNGYLPLGRPQEDVGAVTHEVTTFDQVDAHEAGEERVLVESGVVDPRRQHHDGRVLNGRRRGTPQRVDQAGRIVVHHLDRLAPEELGQHRAMAARFAKT